MPKRLSLILLLAAVVAAAPVHAASGQNAMAFLGLGAGARSAALGGAVSASIDDATAAYWNPAGLARLEGWDISGTHTEWLEDIRYEQVSVARNRGRHGFGLSFATAYAGDFDARDEVGNKGLSFGFSDVALGLSWAYQLRPELTFGASTRYYRESIDDVAADGLAFDLGAQYQTPMDGLSLGLAVRNLGGSVSFDLQNAGSYDLPTVVQGGAAWRRPVAALAGDLALSADFVAERNEDLSLRFGAQYRYREMFSLLAGYRADMTSDAAGVSASEQLNQTQDVSFGASYERKVRFEYAFVPFSSDLGSTHRFSIGRRW